MWDYNQHGADWTGLCATDSSQSPISLPPLASLPNSTDTLWYRYPQRWEEPVVLYNDGLGLSTTFHKKVGGFGLGKYFTTLAGSWSLQQMSIHAPSEHTWGGTHLPLEIQLVHVPSKPTLKPAVLSIGFSRGPIGVPNLFLDTLVAQGIPKRKGEEVRTNLYAGQALCFGDLLRGPEGTDFDAEFVEYTGADGTSVGRRQRRLATGLVHNVPDLELVLVVHGEHLLTVAAASKGIPEAAGWPRLLLHDRVGPDYLEAAHVLRALLDVILDKS